MSALISAAVRRLRADLLSATDAAKAAALVSVNGTAAYPAGSMGLRFGGFVSPHDHPWLAVGDGVADDTAAVSSCVAEALATGKQVLWGARNYLTTANIPNFHAVRHLGMGRIVRGANTFRIAPSEGAGDVNTIYAAPAGTVGNDGMSAAEPVTLARAAEVLLWWAERGLPGKWRVQLAAGTYTGVFNLSSAMGVDFPIDINGPAAGHPNVPTAIIDGTANPGSTAVSIANGAWVRCTDIKAINFTTGIGFTATGANSFLALTNCHTDNTRDGFKASHCAFLSVSGGDYDGNNIASGIGYSGLFNATHSLSQTSNDPLTDATTIHHFARGMLIDEGAQGHLDGVNVTDCTTAGINFKRGAGACNTSGVVLKRNAVGVLAENNDWYNNGIVFGTGADANTVMVRALGDSPELIALTSDFSSRTMRVLQRTQIPAHTGTVDQTNVFTSVQIPEWTVSEAGHTGRLRLFGVCTLTAACTVNLYLYNGTSDDFVSGVTLPIGLTDFDIEAFVYHSAKDSQRSSMRAVGKPGFSSSDYDTGGADLTNLGFNYRIKVQLGADGDSITLSGIVLEGTYGG